MLVSGVTGCMLVSGVIGCMLVGGEIGCGFQLVVWMLVSWWCDRV